MVIITKPEQLRDWFLKSLIDSPNKKIRRIDATKKIHEYMEDGLISVQGDLWYQINYKLYWNMNVLKKQRVIKNKREGNYWYWSFV